MANIEIQSEICATAKVASSHLESCSSVLIEKEENLKFKIFTKTNMRLVSKSKKTT